MIITKYRLPLACVTSLKYTDVHNTHLATNTQSLKLEHLRVAFIYYEHFKYFNNM